MPDVNNASTRLIKHRHPAVRIGGSTVAVGQHNADNNHAYGTDTWNVQLGYCNDGCTIFTPDANMTAIAHVYCVWKGDATNAPTDIKANTTVTRSTN